MRAAKRLLKPDGLMIVKFKVQTPWIAGRLRELVETVFGTPPLRFQSAAAINEISARFFISGNPARIAQALNNPELSAYIDRNGGFETEAGTITSDNWPYFYQREPGLPASVIIMSLTLILLCWLFLAKTGNEIGSLRWHFFFLGAGFLLLEAQTVSRMALLFGTTWVVNSIVIAGFLLVIGLANFLVEWSPAIPEIVGYAGIFVSLAVAYAIPPERLLFDSLWVKGLVATAVLCLPVFFAGIVFIRGFARAGFRSEALGSNLFGALVGGLLESLSMWTGMRSLLIIAAILYGASWIAMYVQEPLPVRAERSANLGSAAIR